MGQNALWFIMKRINWQDMRLRAKNLAHGFIFAHMAFALIVSCAPDTGTNLQNIRWYSLDEGLKIAKAEGRKVFIYFRADW